MTKINLGSLPKISIIVINHNGKHFLKDCLHSIFEINYPKNRYEVILVDNASIDGSIAYVQRGFPQVIIVPLKKGYGYAGGCNRGVRVACGDLYAFLNNDVIVDKNWLYELVQTMSQDSRVAICGSKIVSIDDHSTVQYKGYFLHFLGGVIPGNSHFFKNESGKCINIVGSVQGASFLIKNSVFRELGGFDDDYFLYSEENDLCHRAWINGYFVVYSPNSIVYHFGGGTTGKLENYQSDIIRNRLKSPSRIYYGNRNSIINFLKNLELKNVIVGIIFSFLYFLIQFLILLKNTEIKNIKLLIRSYLWPIANFNKIWIKRITIQTKRKVRDKELIKRKILLKVSDLLRIIMF